MLLGMRTLSYVAADTHLTPHYIRKRARLWDMEVQKTWNQLKTTVKATPVVKTKESQMICLDRR